MHLPGAQPETVVTQNPPADAVDAASPKVNLIFSASDNAERYVMPSFVGKPLVEATAALQKAGFTLGKVQHTAPDESNPAGVQGTILRQYPQAGQRIAAGAAVSFDVRK
jgi:beta-lactam-binding protein with PASTA domain